MTQEIWYTGSDDYIKYVYTQDPKNQMNRFEVFLQDKDYNSNTNIYDAFVESFTNGVPKKVELLFSGGLDSNLVLDLCLETNIPVECITMNIQFDGVSINTHDLYYSEKICREKNVSRKVINLDAKKFYEQGDYRKYLEPFRISVPHTATHLWLIEQCDQFPVLGGEYNWAWNPNEVIAISPMRHSFSHFDKFMRQRGVTGIGNMIGHSQAINLMCMKEHVYLLKNDTNKMYGGEENKVIFLKKHVYEKLTGKYYEPRLRSFGWESVSPLMWDRLHYRQEMLDLFGDNDLHINWGNNVASILGGQPGTWSRLK